MLIRINGREDAFYTKSEVFTLIPPKKFIPPAETILSIDYL